MANTKTDESITSRLAVDIASDRMQAFIELTDADDPRPLTLEEVVGALEEGKIAIDDAVRGRIEEFISLIGGEQDLPEKFLVSEGRSAVEGKDGEFLWHESLQKTEPDWEGDAQVDYYTLNSISTVEKDQPIGTIVPSVAGTDGVDVLGNRLAPKLRPRDVDVDSSVRVSEDDPTAAIADCAGRVLYQRGKLSITEVFEVRQDVDFEVGNIDSSIDVHITGTIHDRFTVKSEKSISVDGAIEAADVEAKGDVLVRGGILQRDKGSVKSESEIVAKFCDAARLSAVGNVRIAKELMHSRVHCLEKLLVTRGVIVGGQIFAREGVEAPVLGNDTNVPTEITVGIEPSVLHEVDRRRKSLEPKRESIARIRQAVQPLLANLKRLSAANKERATELMFQADEAESEIADVEKENEGMIEAARAKGIPYVLFTNIANPGVSVQIGHRRTTLSVAIKGPVKIEKRKIKEVTEFVAVDQLSGSLTVLPSMQVAEEAPVETGAAV